MRRILQRLAVMGVLCFISFLVYSAHLYLFWPWYGRELSIELLVLLVPLNVSVTLLFYNYFLCVATEPGTVPQGWKPDSYSQSDGYEGTTLAWTHRYCQVCHCYKPPRAHHCRHCNRCVLRMDHHCPWINNCVGYFNYGHFIRFLFWVDVTCSYHLAVISKRSLELAMQGVLWNESSQDELIVLVLHFLACVLVLSIVGGISFYQFLNLFGNVTAIERWEKVNVAIMVRQGLIQEVKFPYNLGKLRNIKAILGQSFLLCCLPQPMSGNGLQFELAAHADEREVWPPREHDLPRSVSGPSPSSSIHGDERLDPSLVPPGIRRRQTGDLGAQNEGVDDCSDIESVPSEPPSGYPSSRVRRSLENDEVRPQTREEMLRQYMAEIGNDPYRNARS
ncbi:zf-DHHC-domain-containing protein [Coprinopsis marcescibilis]|uniref:Palmitoyltransferase n=1 Tax=Coprinopsis marcescibilis TaxID=230819 RepID=A0A5C3KHM2_COPMA|nr:zf-DHHC-domain-containing protein [Coprinopsis marcescibilis]